MSGVRLGMCATQRVGEGRMRGVEGERRRASGDLVGDERVEVEAGTRRGKALQTGRETSWVAMRAVGADAADAGRAIFWLGAAASVVS